MIVPPLEYGLKFFQGDFHLVNEVQMSCTRIFNNSLLPSSAESKTRYNNMRNNQYDMSIKKKSPFIYYFRQEQIVDVSHKNDCLNEIVSTRCKTKILLY